HSYSAALAVDAATGVVTVTQENGSQVAFSPSGTSYTAPPRVTATLVHNADGTYTLTRLATQKLVFSATGALQRLVDLNGYATTLGYDATTAKLATITDPEGRSFTVAYSGNHISSIRDSMWRKVDFSYDAAGDLTDVSNVRGLHWSFTYDGHRLRTMRSPRYFGDTTTTPTPVTTNHYDAQGRVDWQSDPLGRTTTFDYTSVANATKVTDPEGNAVLYRFSNGFMVAETRGYGTSAEATWSYGYDPATLGVTRVTDPNGHSVVSTYDASGNLLSRQDALGRTTTLAYNALNQPTTVSDPSGVTTTYAYSAASNLLSQSRPLLNGAGVTVATRTTTYTHGDAAHPEDVTTLVDPAAKSWVATYDGDGNRSSFTDPLGNKTTARYDRLGNVTSTVDARGNVVGANPEQYRTAVNYNELGQPLWSANQLSSPIVDGFTRANTTALGSTETGLA
ncbi:MAG: type IV secretion protein Rhs, partial [Actinobacteria bacterium]|nr:type IV secretion protein Rhs [Actinomycetota bacterium]